MPAKRREGQQEGDVATAKSHAVARRTLGWNLGAAERRKRRTHRMRPGRTP